MDIYEVNKKSKASVKYKKLIDTQIELLKVYLNEDCSITNVEARDRLEDETGLEANITAVGDEMKKLKKRASPYYNSTDSTTSHIMKSKQAKYDYKIKDKHIELLNEYLRGNNYIKPIEARDLLHRETGLEISISHTSTLLRSLREEMGLGCDSLDTSIIKDGKLNNKLKIKDSHLACLKSYLKKDRFIRFAEATRQLHSETGLKVSTKTVAKTMRRLRKEMTPNSTSLHSSPLKSEDSKFPSRSNLKIMDEHKACLKRYLKQDKNIGSIEAKNRLHKDTGLEVSICQIRINLRRLREEMGHEYTSYYKSSTKNINTNRFVKIKDSHLECLKNLLKKNRFIRFAEATRQLYSETGLKVSTKTVARAMRLLRKEMCISPTDLDVAIVKGRHPDYESNLKDTILAFLKKYLNNNRFIGPVDAMNKLREETNLDVDILAIHQSLKTLKKEASLIT